MGTDANNSPRNVYARFGKPAFDRTVGLVLALVTFPAMLTLLAVSWAAFGWPPLQRVTRIGRNRRHFNLYRINTRRDHRTDLRGRQLRISRWLRRTSLDELPQLWNVVLGQMSLVGPRPIDPAEAFELDATSARRHRMRPGVTGPWQISARGDGRPLTDHVSIDLMYVERLSLTMDLAILARTVPALIKRREEV